METTLFDSASTRLALPEVSQNRLSPDYISLMHTHPVLDEPSERRLAMELYDNGNLAAAQNLVFSNLRGVVYVARNYMGYGLVLMDLVQEGTIGLMKAVKAFDPHQNVRLFAWALPWIKSEIQQYVVRNWKMVKAATTDAKKKLFFNVRRLKKDALPVGENIRNIAQALNIKESDVREMDAYMTGHDSGLDETIDMPALERPDLALEDKQRDAVTAQAVSSLRSIPERESRIIEARYMREPSLTLQELAAEMDISVERVRQLETQGLGRLKKLLGFAPRQV